MHSNITAVCFRGDNGYLSLLNIYNKITNNDTLTYLGSYLDRNMQLVRPSCQDCVVWLRDFNCHHPIWKEEANKNEMPLAPPKGIPTFQSAAGNWMCPDNVWHSNTPDNPIAQ
jgi:hypothetical protein